MSYFVTDSDSDSDDSDFEDESSTELRDYLKSQEDQKPMASSVKAKVLNCAV